MGKLLQRRHFMVSAAAMAVAFVVGVVWMPRGRVDAEQLTPADPPTADKLITTQSH